MKFPTINEVSVAPREQICEWHRFLPLPSNDEELAILGAIEDIYVSYGGFTPEISKKIGWKPR